MDPPPEDPAVNPNDRAVAYDDEGCHEIFAPDLLPTFELTVEQAVWDQLYSEWVNGVENEILEEMGVIDDYHPYHPLAEFRYRDQHGEYVIENAGIRLRGNPTYWLEQNKMQLQLKFNEFVKGQRFLGLKRMAFDAATFNRHFLRDRLALSTIRRLGIPTPCANNARLMINGEYYGLFTSVEKIDEVFLRPRFASPSGDLWKRANWELKTNEDMYDDTRLEALKEATTLAELESLLDVDSMIQVAASQAAIPDSDGFWAGGLNFYVYDDPVSGKFVVLPWDLDNTFDRLPFDVDPVTWHKEERFHGRPWYDIALADPGYFADYIAAVERALAEGYETEWMHARIDEWSAQIQEAAFTDTNKPWSNNLYLQKIGELHQYIDDRAAFVRGWLACWQAGGTNDGAGQCVPPTP